MYGRRQTMKLPERKDCIHAPVCKYDDPMCPMDCGYFQRCPEWKKHNNEQDKRKPRKLLWK